MSGNPDIKFRVQHNFFSEPLCCGAISVIQIGRLYFKPNATIGAHMHKDWFELTVVTSGCGVIKTDRDEVAVQKGDIHISYPNEIHDIFSDAEKSLCYDFFAFRSTDEEWQKALAELALRNPSAASRVLRDERISRLLTEGISAVSGDGPFGDRLRNAIFEQLVIYLLRAKQNDTQEKQRLNPSEAELLCYRMMSYIDAHISTMHSLCELTQDLHYSYGYLSKLFKRVCGRSVADYYNERRLQIARDLLMQGLSVTAVAERMNYASVYSFSGAFKKRYGEPPYSIGKTK